MTVEFEYNDLVSFDALSQQNRGQIACVIMEAERGIGPEPNYLQGVHDLCRANEAFFIIDEMITGYRWATGEHRRSTASLPIYRPSAKQWPTVTASELWLAAKI